MDELGAQNGAQTGSVPAMALVTETLQRAVDELAKQRDTLTEQLATVKHELGNYQKALALIEAPPPGSTPRRGRSSLKSSSGGANRSGTRISGDRLAEVETAIREYATEHGGDPEFRQIDIREVMGAGISSGISSIAFAELREREVIRIARKDGNNLYFRMAHAAATEAE
jgi:hypothetical protein